MRIIEASTRPIEGSSLHLVELHTDEEITGRALCEGVAAGTVTEMATAILLGRDPRGVSTLWDELGKAASNGSSAYSDRARAVLDIACWDLKARYHDEPLWRSLGGSRPHAVAYGSWSADSVEEDDLRDAFRNLASPGGLRGGLLRLGNAPDGDARLLGLLCDVLSEHAASVDLMIDLGMTWPDEAIRRISALEADFDITWVKGVAREGDFRGCNRVADSIRAAVCAGGDLASESGFLPLLQAVNVIEIDMQRLGVTGALRVAEAAFGYELPVTLAAVPGNLPVQIASVLPNLMGMEIVSAATRTGVVGSAARFEAGRAIAGDALGTGIDVSQGAVVQ